MSNAQFIGRMIEFILIIGLIIGLLTLAIFASIGSNRMAHACYDQGGRWTSPGGCVQPFVTTTAP